ncbi:hypothetical protein M9H77_30564 [Catharanthus roseus]|uniref:Uncharacterized protein n=1 Tax=Catharanthus roseus TaxID=4058 RepID=A0ACB9ZYX3_CATRO|nr:hypothetical protein M9H77_30564 [Catharanthus roseus]
MWVVLSGFKLSAQKIYNVVAKIKKNRMQGRNTVEEVLCLSTIRDYTVFYRNREDSNMLSDIVVAHLTSIEMLRTYRMKYVIFNRFYVNFTGFYVYFLNKLSALCVFLKYVQHATVGSGRDDPDW